MLYEQGDFAGAAKYYEKIFAWRQLFLVKSTPTLYVTKQSRYVVLLPWVVHKSRTNICAPDDSKEGTRHRAPANSNVTQQFGDVV